MPKQSKIIKTFDLLPKKSFDLLPNLRETFDLVKRSSEIRSSDQLPVNFKNGSSKSNGVFFFN